MTIEFSSGQRSAYDLLKALESGSFGLYLALVVTSMFTPISRMTEMLAVTALIGSITVRLAYATWAGTRKVNPRWPALGATGRRSDRELAVLVMVKRDLRWQAARAFAVLLYAPLATSLPDYSSRALIAAGSGAVLAFASTLGERRFAAATKESKMTMLQPHGSANY